MAVYSCMNARRGFSSLRSFFCTTTRSQFFCPSGDFRKGMVKAAERTHDGRALGSSALAATAFAFGGSLDLVRLHQNYYI